MTYLLDSSVLIRFFQGKEDARGIVTQLEPKGQLVVSSLTVSELRTGWTDEQTSHLLPYLYKLVVVQDVTKEIAELSGKLRHDYRPKGKTLHTVDTVIAATSIVKDCYLVTFDKDFYPISEVNLLPIASLPDMYTGHL